MRSKIVHAVAVVATFLFLVSAGNEFEQPVVSVAKAGSFDFTQKYVCGYVNGTKSTCSWVTVFSPFNNTLGSVGGGGGPPKGGGGGQSSPNNSTPTTDSDKDKNPDCNRAGDPIQISQQSKIEKLTLFSAPGEMGLAFHLFYISPLGWNDSLSYWLDLNCGQRLTPPPGGGGAFDVIEPDGSTSACQRITFHRPDGSTIVFSGIPGTLGNYPEVGGGGLATLVRNSDGSYTLHDENADTLVFTAGGQLRSIVDVSGVGWTLTDDTNGRPIKVTHTSGRYFTLSYQLNVGTPSTTTVTVTDPAGNAYKYNKQSLSWSVIFHGPYQVNNVVSPGSPTTTITFHHATIGQGSDLTQMDYNGVPYSYTTYDTADRAMGTYLAGGTEATSIVYSFPVSGKMTAKVTNPLGHVATFDYQSIGGQYLLISANDQAVSTCGATTHTATYDSNGNLTKTVDNNGVTHTYAYAANGQLQSETEAYGTAAARTATYVWDSNQQLNRLLSATVSGQTKISYTYHAQNRLASVSRTNLSSVGTANQTLTTTYSYALYGNGLVKTLTIIAPSPGGTNKFTYQYDAYGNVTSVTNGLGHATTYSDYNALGEVGKIVGTNGDETDFTYDARGRIASKTMHPNGSLATWTYTYDGFGLLAKLTAPNGELTNWTRNSVMRVTQITHNDKNGTSTETFAYDANGSVTSDVIARGSVVGKATTYVYDGLGRVYQVKGSNGQALTYAYDGNGNTLSVTDALGHKTSHGYDALNRATSITNAANGVTSFAYDKGDNVVKVTDPRGLVTAYAYDGLGDLWNQISPDTGTTTFIYDSYGRLATKTRADGVVSGYSYDALNRPTGVAAGGQSRAYTWDACSNGKGRLCTASTNAASVNYSYTPEGWIAARGLAITSGPVNVVGYGYNAMGQVSQVLYPDGNQTLYDYINGVVSAVRLKIGSSTVNGVTNIVYRPGDLAMSGWTSYNGVANAIGYDSDLRPTSLTAAGVQNLALHYDAADRIIKITNGVHSNYTQNLTYDPLARLTSVSSSAHTASYTYDANGNRTYQAVNGVATNFAYAATSNRLNGATGGLNATYSYNAYGSTTTVNGGAAYTYDPFGRLVNASGAAFLISAEDQRLRKTFGGDITYFVPDAGGVLLADSQNGTWRDYVWLNGRMVAMITGGSVYSLHGDQTGRTLAVTGPTSPAVVWEAQGLPFDRNTITGSGSFFRLGFPGQYFDSEDNLWHNGYRDYDSTSGRYIESDLIGLAGGINTYVYVGNNPLTRIDPFGLCDKQKCSNLQRLAAQAARRFDKFADVSAKYSVAAAILTAGAFAVEAPSAGLDTPVTGALGATTAGLGGLSTGSGIIAGALKTYASGWDFRYVGSAATSAVLARFGGAFAGALPRGSVAAELVSGAVESKALSYSMPEPPCVEP